MIKRSRRQLELEKNCYPIRITPISRLNRHQVKILTSSPPDPELTESIKRNGIINPIILDIDGFIIDGSHRVNSAISLGLTHIPTRKVKRDSRGSIKRRR